MKTTKAIFIPLCLFVLWGCSKSSEPGTVQFETTLTTNVHVSETSSATDQDISVSALLDATTDPQIQQYASNIESYTVDSVVFAIVNYSSSLSDEIYFGGDFGFGNASASSPAATCSVNHLPVTHVEGTGFFPLMPCTSITGDIANILGQGTSLKIFMDGALTKAPVSFTVQVKLKVQVKAKGS